MTHRRLLRREWVFPVLMLAFVGFMSRPAHATRDVLAAQAAADMHCNSVSIIPSSDTEFLATGCGQDRTYTCGAGEDDACMSSDDDGAPHGRPGPDAEDDAAADAIANAVTDMACACASAGLAHAASGSHSHSHHSRSSGVATHQHHSK